MTPRCIRFFLTFVLLAVVGPAGAADRLVTLGGAVTETVFALGLGDRIVAVDSTSTAPAAAEALPDLGYIRQISVEPVLAFDPDRVFALSSLGPPATVERLRETLRHFHLLDDPKDAEATLDLISRLGALLDREPEAMALRRSVKADLDALRARIADRPRPRCLLFLRPPEGGSAFTAGSGTRADTMLQLAGGRNAFADARGYRQLGAETLFSLNPEVILVGRNTDAEGPDAVAAVTGDPLLSRLPAVQAGRVHAIDLQLLRFGPSIAEAAKLLANRIHPELAD
ncbi:MAG: heme/hemin ABC transporter substrate-binding protein [Opitutales bacterium]